MNCWLTFGLLAVAAVASPVEGGSTPTSALSSNSHGTKAPKVTLSPQIKAATAQSENSNSDSETLWETGGPYNTFISHFIDSDGKWTASDSSYITQVQTTTKDGKATTTTVTAPVAVMSGTDNDINILLSPALMEKLNDLSATNVCSQKRDSNCLADTIENIKNSDDPLVKQYRDYTQDMDFASDELKEKYKDLADETDDKLQKRGVLFGVDDVVFDVAYVTFAFYLAVVGVFKFGKERVQNFVGTIHGVPTDYPKMSVPSKTDDDDGKCPKDAPTGKDAPLCDDCDGSDKDLKCTTGKYKGCTCIPTVTINEFYTFSDAGFKEQMDFFASALKVADAYETKPNITCSRDYDDSIMVDQSIVERLAGKFCSGSLDKATTKNLTTHDIDSTSYEEYIFGFSYDPASGGDTCGNNCTDVFHSILQTCEGSDSHYIQDKGSSKLDCGASYGYNIFREISSKENEAERTTVDTKKCASDDSRPRNMVAGRDELLGFARKICKTAAGSGQWYFGNQVEDTFTASENYASVKITAIAPQIYKNKREVSPLASLDENDCLSNFKSLVDNCDTDTTTKKQGGELSTKDGSFWSIIINRDTTVRETSCNNIQTDSMMPVDRDLAKGQLHELCKHDFADAAHPNSPHWYRISSYGGDIEVDIRFADDQTNCLTAADEDLFWPIDCEGSLMKAIDNCDTDTTTEKYGGTLLFNTDHGCWSVNVGFPLMKDKSKSDKLGYNSGELS